MQDMARDMAVVIDEWTKPVKECEHDITPRDAAKQKKKIKKLARQGRLRPLLDRDWET